MNKSALIQILLDNAVGPGNWSRQFNRAEIEVLLEAAVDQVAYDAAQLMLGASRNGQLFAAMIMHEHENGDK